MTVCERVEDCKVANHHAWLRSNKRIEIQLHAVVELRKAGQVAMPAEVRMNEPLRMEQVDHIALTVSNPDKSALWYQQVLGLERRYQDVWGDYPVMLGAGDTCVALFPSLVTVPAETPDRNETLIMRHFAFRVDAKNYSQAQYILRLWHIPFKEEDHKISRSIYFNDPDGHQLEITTYKSPRVN